MAPIATGAADVMIVVATATEPGNALYEPVETILKVEIAPGVVRVVNISMVAAPPPDAMVPPLRTNISPGK
jgi:hypothetical protein